MKPDVLCKLRENTIFNALKEVKCREIYIWGAGPSGEFIYCALKKFNASVSGFIDGNPDKVGQVFCSTIIYSPDEIKNRAEEVYVFIASEGFYREIADSLEEYGYTEYDYCKVMRYLPKRIQVGVTDRCNLRCPFCVNKTRWSSDFSNHADMSFDSFKKIVDDASAIDIIYLSFGGLGENFLNKDVIKILDYAGDKMTYMDTTTNGVLMNNEVAECVIKNMGEIIFSITGFSAEVYNKHQGFGATGASLRDKVYENVRRFIKKRDSLKSELNISVRYILCSETVDDFKKYAKFWESILDPELDRVIISFFTPLSEVNSKLSESEYGFHDKTAPRNNEINECHELGFTYFVHPDGGVGLCCRDCAGQYIVGNALSDSIENVSNSKRYTDVISAYRYRRYNDLPEICKNCDSLYFNEFLCEYPYSQLKKAASAIPGFLKIGNKRVAFYGVGFELTTFLHALIVYGIYDSIDYVVADDKKRGLFEKKIIEYPARELFEGRSIIVFGNPREKQKRAEILEGMDLDYIFFDDFMRGGSI